MGSEHIARRKPTGRAKTGLSNGGVLAQLIHHVEAQEDFDARTSVVYRFDASHGYVPRKVLSAEQTAVALKQAGVTMEQLFRETGCSIPMDKDDACVLEMIRSLGKEQLGQVLEMIRGCQKTWWLPLMDRTEIPVSERLQNIMRRRIGCYDDRKKLAAQYPVLARYTPASRQCFVRAEDMAALAAELDVHVSSITELGPAIPWYSNDPAVERVFAEYQMLSRSLRGLILKFTKLIMEEKECADQTSG